MSEQDTAQERTEQPTEKRKKESREKGQVARSKDLGIFLSLSLAAGLFLIMGAQIAIAVSGILREGLSIERAAIFDSAAPMQAFSLLATGILAAMVPFVIVMLFIALIGSIALGGVNFSWKALAFSVDKINPISGLKKIFSLRSLVELLKSIIKVSAIAFCAYVFSIYFLEDVLHLWTGSADRGITRTSELLVIELFILCFAMLLVAMVDVPYQLWENIKKLRMSRQEIKDESKETDGKPEVKAKIRQLQRQRAQNRMMSDIPEASVVITNPSHFAVAIKYEAHGGINPVVVAKGQDLMAAQIRKIAEDHSVPVCEMPPLARVLFWNVDVGAEIPKNLYMAVAQVLAYVFLLNSGAGKNIKAPTNIEIPEEYMADVTRGGFSA